MMVLPTSQSLLMIIPLHQLVNVAAVSSNAAVVVSMHPLAQQICQHLNQLVFVLHTITYVVT